MTKLLRTDAASSTGWRSEVAILFCAALLLAAGSDLAERYGWPSLVDTIGNLSGIVSGVLALRFSRARQAAKKGAQAQVDGSAGA